MKPANVLRASLLALLAACAAPEPPAHAGDLLLGASLERAILAQSSLFPCHFESGGTGLNELGRRDLGVLAEHLRTHSGSLLIRRGDASAALYQARVQAVLAALAEAGVPQDQLAVHDGLPSGTGLASVRVVEVIKKPLSLSGAGVSAAVPIVTESAATP